MLHFTQKAINTYAIKQRRRQKTIDKLISNNKLVRESQMQKLKQLEAEAKAYTSPLSVAIDRNKFGATPNPNVKSNDMNLDQRGLKKSDSAIGQPILAASSSYKNLKLRKVGRSIGVEGPQDRTRFGEYMPKHERDKQVLEVRATHFRFGNDSSHGRAEYKIGAIPDEGYHSGPREVQKSFDPISKVKKLPKNVDLKHTRAEDALGGYKTLNRYYHNEDIALGGSQLDLNKYKQERSEVQDQKKLLKQSNIKFQRGLSNLEMYRSANRSMNESIHDRVLTNTEVSLERELNKQLIQKNKMSKIDLTAASGREYKNMTMARSTFQDSYLKPMTRINKSNVNSVDTSPDMGLRQTSRSSLDQQCDLREATNFAFTQKNLASGTDKETQNSTAATSSTKNLHYLLNKQPNSNQSSSKQLKLPKELRVLYTNFGSNLTVKTEQRRQKQLADNLNENNMKAAVYGKQNYQVNKVPQLSGRSVDNASNAAAPHFLSTTHQALNKVKNNLGNYYKEGGGKSKLQQEYADILRDQRASFKLYSYLGSSSKGNLPRINEGSSSLEKDVKNLNSHFENSKYLGIRLPMRTLNNFAPKANTKLHMNLLATTKPITRRPPAHLQERRSPMEMKLHYSPNWCPPSLNHQNVFEKASTGFKQTKNEYMMLKDEGRSSTLMKQQASTEKLLSQRGQSQSPQRDSTEYNQNFHRERQLSTKDLTYDTSGAKAINFNIARQSNQGMALGPDTPLKQVKVGEPAKRIDSARPLELGSMTRADQLEPTNGGETSEDKVKKLFPKRQSLATPNQPPFNPHAIRTPKVGARISTAALQLNLQDPLITRELQKMRESSESWRGSPRRHTQQNFYNSSNIVFDAASKHRDELRSNQNSRNELRSGTRNLHNDTYKTSNQMYLTWLQPTPTNQHNRLSKTLL